MSSELVDITIIGGGPTGLYGLFYAGMRGVTSRVIDALPELGGQLTALYPEKDVFDVAGFPKVLAKDLARNLVEQAMQFDTDLCLDERVLHLHHEDDHMVLETSGGMRPTHTVVIAAGKGAFNPRKLEVPGFDRFFENGVWPHVRKPESFRDRRLLIVGGGDSAFDWSWGLCDVAAQLSHIHRSNRYRAHARTVSLVEEAVAQGKMELLTYHEVVEIHGEARVEAVTIRHNKTDERRTLQVDDVIALLGFVPKIGPIAEWGLELEGNTIRVNSRMMTSVAGVYAAGDIATYEGKLELISTGFGEAAIAVNNAVHFMNPGAKVDPGHSTSSKAFKGK